jgi:CrcB protein
LSRAAAVMAGGAAGTLARAGVAELLPHASGAFPWATLLVNLAGTAILARLTVVVAGESVWRALIGVGFCGALTTFSTFQLETVRLADEGHPGVATAYLAVSLVAGLAVAAVAGRHP